MVFNKKWFLVILASFSLTGTALAAKKRKYATGLIVPADKDFGVPFLAPAEHSIPPNYDLREEGLASPVKNQGSCGSCWAFAGIASMESAVMRVNGGTEMDLSEQQIVSCDQEAQGCSGGWQPFEFMVANGVGAEASFPYAARNLSCKRIPTVAKALRWANVGAANRRATVQEVQQAVVDFGALWITVGANNNWMNVSGGEITNCANSSVNHAVAVTGYTTEESRAGTKTKLLIKNSWGTDWGDEGYVKTPLGCNNLGSVVSFVVAEGQLCTPPKFGLGKQVEMGRGDKEYHVDGLEAAGLAYTWSKVGTRSAGTGPIIVKSNETANYVVATKNACGTWTQMVRIAAH